MNAATARRIACAAAALLATSAMSAAGASAASAPGAQSAPLAPGALTWQAPPECPDEAFVRSEIDRLLAGGPRPSTHVEAHAVVRRTAEGRWRAHIATTRDGASGERSIDAASCGPLAEATALVVALTIDPTRASARRTEAAAPAGSASPAAPVPPPAAVAPAPIAASPSNLPGPATAPEPGPKGASPAAPVPPPAAVAPAAPSRPPPPAAAEPRRSGTPIHYGVFAAAGGDIGTLPAPALGAALTASLFLGRVRLDAYGEHWFGRTEQATAAVSYGGTISLWSGGVDGGFVVSRGAFEIAPCAGLELGDLHGIGLRSLEAPSANDGAWLAIVAGAHTSARLVGPLRVGLLLEGAAPVLRDRFVVQINGQTTPVFRPSPLVGRALLGPELRF